MSIKFPAWKIFLFLAIACALTSEFFQHVAKRSEQGQVEYAQKQLLRLEKEIQQSLNTISAFTTDSQYHEFFIHQGQQRNGFSFFYFENGALKHWSDNEVELPENFISTKLADGTPLNLPNGIYEAFEKESGNKKLIGLILLRRNFSYENKYLVNHFNHLLGFDCQFQVAEGKGEYEIKSSSGNNLLSVNYSRVVPDELPFKTPAWFYLLAFLFLFSAFFFFFRNRSAGSIQILLAGLFLFLLRWMMISFRLPGEMYYNDFFSPKVYGSSFFFNSLGDFFLNAVAFLSFSGIIYSARNSKRSPQQSPNNRALLTLYVAALVALATTIHFLVGDLVLNSKITFGTNISSLTVNTVVALLSIFSLLWSFYFLAIALVSSCRNIFLSGSSRKPIHKFQSGILALIVLSVYASFTITHFENEKESEDQKLFAQRLDSRQDHLAEYLFEDAQKKISDDSLIQNSILQHENVSESILPRLQQNYFTGYLSKFDARVSVFNIEGISFDSLSSANLASVREQFSSQGRRTASEYLVELPDESGRLKYLSLFPIKNSSGGLMGTIAVFLESRASQVSEGFPELLVSSTVAKSRDEANYSYARYSNGSLIFAGGSFSYPFHSTTFNTDKDLKQISSDGFDHVIYKSSPTSIIVVSKPAETFFDSLSFFSYVFLLFLLTFLVGYLVLYVIETKNRFQLSLKQRIRSTIISLVVISFVLIAAGTSVYIVRKYDADKNAAILSRLNAMWFALTDRFTFDQRLSASGKNEWTAEMNKIVSNFNLDFNIYDEQGNLFYSSQPKLFDKGIISTRINPEALFEILQFGHTQFVHSESIGKLTYAAAYAPFTDPSGNITGCLNIPYFEKQNELNKEISGFLSALINIYLLLLVVSLLLALVITSRITKPLLLIQEKLSSLKLGSKNEIIEWKRNDEIGQLVFQYNRMVEALAESADKLARSERESAWREMAQQVAHEIKNPLTPMKLSVQHLQRAWNEKSGNLDELFQRISKTMIEQIDALSNIASEFSNFAKMPRAKNETLDLNDIIRSSINLFDDTPNVSIHFSEDAIERKIFADREQLIRAFSNLIKNSVQAIPETRKGNISISVKTENGFHVVSIADNGTGIASNLHSKIFTPNFTTKTSGMGLGLAMVKSTVEAIGGAIKFETKEGEGSVFHISIPVQ